LYGVMTKYSSPSVKSSPKSSNFFDGKWVSDTIKDTKSDCNMALESNSVCEEECVWKYEFYCRYQCFHKRLIRLWKMVNEIQSAFFMWWRSRFWSCGNDLFWLWFLK
jgi:hypothetical protein